LRVLALGAHCDDIEIGAGATLLRLLGDRPGAALCILIAASDDGRAAEARASAEALGARAGIGELHVHVGSLPEVVLPAHTGDVRDLVLEHGRPFSPDLVLAPHALDRHQDHRTVAEVAHQLFRDHPIFEYEIAKFDGDLHTPNVYVPVSPEIAAMKVDHLHEHFPSQHGRTWFDREAFFALLRLRGIECNARYAEGFHVRKLAL
jgi:LmbE family N-acetylglucosaminyl deacetylase